MCQGADLNRRPKAYESSALPLSYPGKKYLPMTCKSHTLFLKTDSVIKYKNKEYLSPDNWNWSSGKSAK